MSSDAGWDRSTLLSRVSDTATRQRFAAGSPNAAEVAQYRKSLLGHTSMRTAAAPRVAVLGMTPELRQMVLPVCADLLTIDRSAEAIALYRDWMPPALAARERIIEGEWSAELLRARGGFDAILGDGVCGNLATVEQHAALLDAARQALAPPGAMILRHALIPADFEAAAHRAETQIERFRAGKLSAAAFGLGMRLWGSFAEAYDSRTRSLDNRLVYERYEALHGRGVLTDEEHAIVRRYYFGGRTMLLPKREWEALLAKTGFSHRCITLSGENWYGYYPIYACQLAGSRARRRVAHKPPLRREVHLCLIEQPTESGFGALMEYWINARCRRCSAELNRDVGDADVVWILTQDPLGESGRKQVLKAIERRRPDARILNHPDRYDAYHRPDCFARLRAAGVPVPRDAFTEADRGRTQVVYKRMGEQMSGKTLEPFAGPREGYRSFEFVDSRNAAGLYRRFRSFYVVGAVRPSKAMTCGEWNVCLKNDPTIVPSFEMTPDEVEAVRRIAQTLGLDFFAVDFLRRRDDDAAFFLDINVYPRLNSLLGAPPRHGLQGEFHTFDTRPRLCLPEPGNVPFPEVFDHALGLFAAGAACEVPPGALNALVQPSNRPAPAIEPLQLPPGARRPGAARG